MTLVYIIHTNVFLIIHAKNISNYNNFYDYFRGLIENVKSSKVTYPVSPQIHTQSSGK